MVFSCSSWRVTTLKVDWTLRLSPSGKKGVSAIEVVFHGQTLYDEPVIELAQRSLAKDVTFDTIGSLRTKHRCLWLS